MTESAQTALLRIFHDMPDPRQLGKVSHKLHDILVIVVCATLADLECFTEFVKITPRPTKTGFAPFSICPAEFEFRKNTK
ncbi:MAG: transposase family protein [Phycisphaerae bacterium]|nr:transposase family protein [Phycisphaerae bacterium]